MMMSGAPTAHEEAAALTLLEFSSPAKPCMTPRDKSALESPPGALPLSLASPNGSAGLLSSPGYVFNVSGCMDEKSLSPFFATLSPSRPFGTVEGGMASLLTGSAARAAQHGSNSKQRSASKLTAADGSKKTFCTKLNFPSEPAHKIWLALKEKNPAELQPPSQAEAIPAGSGVASVGPSSPLLAAGLSSSPSLPDMGVTSVLESHEDWMTAGGNGDSLWLNELEEMPGLLPVGGSHLLASPGAYLDTEGLEYTRPYEPPSPFSQHLLRPQQRRPDGRTPLTPSAAMRTIGPVESSNIQFRYKKSTTKAPQASSGLEEYTDEDSLLSAAGIGGVPQSPMLPADPSRLHSKHPSSVMGGARLSLAPSSASSSSSSSGGGGKVTMSFSRLPGQMVPSLAASTHPLFSPPSREHTRGATPRHRQPSHARKVHVEVEPPGQAPKGSAPRRTNNGACNCKKSRCLKMYCECFRDDRDCGPNCNCKGCANNAYHEEERQEAKRRIVDRKPAIARRTNNARAPSPTHTQIIAQPSPAAMPSSRSALQGGVSECDCRDSGCENGMCACHVANQGCSSACKCAQCNNPSGAHSGVSNWDGFAATGAQAASASGLGSPSGGMRAMHTGAGFSSYPQTAGLGATPSGKSKKIRFCLSPMAAASASPAAMFAQSGAVRPKRLHDAMAAASPLSSPIRKVGTTKRPTRTAGQEEFLLPVFGPQSAINKKGSLQILSFLDEEDMAMVSLVSKQWNRLSLETDHARNIFGVQAEL